MTRLDPTRPTLCDIAPLVGEIYERSRVGRCLHIVLDDCNVRDSDVMFCVDVAKREGHADCLELALALMRMSKTQRAKASRCG